MTAGRILLAVDQDAHLRYIADRAPADRAALFQAIGQVRALEAAEARRFNRQRDQARRSAAAFRKLGFRL